MYRKTITVLLLLTLVNQIGFTTSFALPQYIPSLKEVYGESSCSTCHVNDTADGPRTSYGKLFENQPDHATNPSAALRAIGAPPAANVTLTPTVISTPAETATLTAIPTVTTIMPTIAATKPPAAPGFGIVSSLLGLFALAALALPARRKNR